MRRRERPSGPRRVNGASRSCEAVYLRGKPRSGAQVGECSSGDCPALADAAEQIRLRLVLRLAPIEQRVDAMQVRRAEKADRVRAEYDGIAGFVRLTKAFRSAITETETRL